MYQRRAQRFSQALTSLLAEAASEESVFVDVTPFSGVARTQTLSTPHVCGRDTSEQNAFWIYALLPLSLLPCF